MVELRVPGGVYHFCLDPGVTEKPSEEQWPAADLVRRGRGWQAIYVCTEEVAADIRAWVRKCALGLIGFCSGDDRDAQTALRWANNNG
jgi:hypothetical protein